MNLLTDRFRKQLNEQIYQDEIESHIHESELHSTRP